MVAAALDTYGRLDVLVNNAALDHTGELIAVPMNSPAPAPPPQPSATPASEIVLALAAATVNRVYVAQADRSGPERGIEWSQASAICDPDGGLIAGPVSGVGLLRATGDLRRARDKALGERNHVLTDRRTELYVTAARSRGMSETRVVLKHAFRNSLIPIVTVLGLQVGGVLTGAVITETIFAWPGVGRLLIQSIGFRDYPLVQGCILLIAVTYVSVNLLTDMAYAFLDPRIRLSRD